MIDSANTRSNLVEFLKQDLVGPADGEKETLEDPPRIRYLAAVLFPQGTMRNESDTAGGIESSDRPDEQLEQSFEEQMDHQDEGVDTSLQASSVEPESEHDDSVTLTNSYRPSAMGLSFFVNDQTSQFRINVQAAEYASRRVDEDGFQRTKYDRVPLNTPLIEFDLGEDSLYPEKDWEISAGLKIKGVFRKRVNGQTLVTISLYNTTLDSRSDSRTFFQCEFSVVSKDGAASIVEYKNLGATYRDVEEASLALLYRNRKEYAVGHGCAAHWGAEQNNGVAEVKTSALPASVVPPVNPVSGDEDYMNMEFLSGSDEGPVLGIPKALEKLCTEYESWIHKLEDKCESLGEFDPAPQHHIQQCKTAVLRMRRGIELLKSDRNSLEAFQLANRAMLMQQVHSKLRRSIGEPWEKLPTKVDDYSSSWPHKRGFWRSFQVAFILMNLRGLETDEQLIDLDGEPTNERDIVDLIWFPTGGGKTEAYLGLAAYMIFKQRLDGEEDAGCKVLMRYTLRLLTSQQFQRASSMICACEVLRRTNVELFGETPISIGLYVGLSLTPNKEEEALKSIARMEKGKDQKNPFQLLHCPWCGTELNNQDRYGYVERSGRMVFLCPSESENEEGSCPFAKRSSHLPITVVDESIYSNPPTLLIATVDKLAMLAWLKNSGSLLKLGGGPALIIQDELHLISGPLGSLVGLYEGVFEYICSLNNVKPKIVASTATIRSADQQCRALYNRSMAQFPPPGLDASDSYFSKEAVDAPGRLYVGFLPTAASSPLTAQIRSIVAMQQGILLVAPPDEDFAIDPYWTLVQYFGSLKELGHAATFVTADIPEFIPTMHRRFDVPPERKRWMRTSEELTSRKNEDEIPQILKKLEVRYKSEAPTSEQALDTLLATNMISVGVDVDRLGLMLIVTQPKGTSEYIQASSRVGRSEASPGLVFTLYNAARPRDRSHYEHFCGYHQAYYRYVEPTSVTPFSPPAMHRALHAILVIAGRHICNWESPSDANFEDPDFMAFIDFLRNRVISIDEDHLPEFDSILRGRIEEWDQFFRIEKWGGFSETSEESVLMRPAGKPPKEHNAYSWETPTSMRNVDVECVATVVPRFPAMENDNV